MYSNDDKQNIMNDAQVALGISEHGPRIDIIKQFGDAIDSAPESIRELNRYYKQFAKYQTLDVIPDHDTWQLVEALDEAGYLNRYDKSSLDTDFLVNEAIELLHQCADAGVLSSSQFEATRIQVETNNLRRCIETLNKHPRLKNDHSAIGELVRVCWNVSDAAKEERMSVSDDDL